MRSEFRRVDVLKESASFVEDGWITLPESAYSAEIEVALAALLKTSVEEVEVLEAFAATGTADDSGLGVSPLVLRESAVVD